MLAVQRFADSDSTFDSAQFAAAAAAVEKVALVQVEFECSFQVS